MQGEIEELVSKEGSARLPCSSIAGHQIGPRASRAGLITKLGVGPGCMIYKEVNKHVFIQCRSVHLCHHPN